MSFGVKPHGKIEKLPCGGTEEIVPPGDNVEGARGVGEWENEQVAAVALPRDGDGRDDGEAKSGGDKIFDALLVVQPCGNMERVCLQSGSAEKIIGGTLAAAAILPEQERV